MQKMLIVDTSEQWRELLERAARCDYYVRTCCDGMKALEIMDVFEPDVLVMDLMLSGTDGLSVLKALENRPVRPRTIITGRYFSNFITSSLEHYRVDHVILKPCTIQSILDRVAEVLAVECEEPVLEQDPYDYVTALLVALGAPTSQQGFRFLRSGILLLMQDPTQQLTKELYPAIAREHNTSAANVEKGLRTTVTRAWLNRRDDIWHCYFPMTSAGQVPKPTAGQFLQRLADATISIKRKMA